MRNGIRKIGEFDGIPVYQDDYMSEDDVKFGRGPKYPDSYYVGPVIYQNGVALRPDGTPIVQENKDLGYETQFIITGATMNQLERKGDELREYMREKYGE